MTASLLRSSRTTRQPAARMNAVTLFHTLLARIERLVGLPPGWLWAEFGRLLRFGIVGVAATATYFVIATFSVEAMGTSPTLGSVFGYAGGYPVSYFGHRRYTFRAHTGSHQTQAIRFAVVTALNFSVYTSGVWVLTEVLALHHRLAFLAVSVAVPVLSYLMNRIWTFAPSAAGGGSSASDQAKAGGPGVAVEHLHGIEREAGEVPAEQRQLRQQVAGHGDDRAAAILGLHDVEDLTRARP
jgi:putative flippase GtrA